MIKQRKLVINACLEYKPASNRGRLPSAVEANKGPSDFVRKYCSCSNNPSPPLSYSEDPSLAECTGSKANGKPTVKLISLVSCRQKEAFEARERNQSPVLALDSAVWTGSHGRLDQSNPLQTGLHWGTLETEINFRGALTVPATSQLLQTYFTPATLCEIVFGLYVSVDTDR